MYHFIINMKDIIEQKIVALNSREEIKVLEEGFKVVPSTNGIKLYVNGKYINTYGDNEQLCDCLDVLEETLIAVNGNK